MSMKTNIVAPIGGVLILAGGIALSVYTATNAPVLKESKAKIVQKYVNLSQKALVSGDLLKAEKFAKKALAVDATNKLALNSYKSVVLASCPKTAPIVNNSATTTSTTPPVKKPQPEAEDEMGCI